MRAGCLYQSLHASPLIRRPALCLLCRPRLRCCRAAPRRAAGGSRLLLPSLAFFLRPPPRSKDVAAALGITAAAPAFAVGRNFADFGLEAVPSAGHKAFEGGPLGCLGCVADGGTHAAGAAAAGLCKAVAGADAATARGGRRRSLLTADPPPCSLPLLQTSTPAEKDLEKALAAFVAAEKLPAFLEFSQETSQSIFGSGISNQVKCGAAGGGGGGRGV